MLVALHQALLYSIRHEHDPLTLAATLRALGTLLLGAPYHRLPPQLLPLCVGALLDCLARTTPGTGPGGLPVDKLPVASACLSCLAAAFSTKGAAPAAKDQLLPDSDSSGSTTAGNGPGIGVDRSGGGASAQHLLQLLFAYAGCQQSALQLEAVMALRGLVQQHTALVQDCWELVLTIGRAGTAMLTAQPAVPRTPQMQTGGQDGGEACRVSACEAELQAVVACGVGIPDDASPHIASCCWLQPARTAHCPRRWLNSPCVYQGTFCRLLASS